MVLGQAFAVSLAVFQAFRLSALQSSSGGPAIRLDRTLDIRPLRADRPPNFTLELFLVFMVKYVCCEPHNGPGAYIFLDHRSSV
jgi:hypothetical protein